MTPASNGGSRGTEPRWLEALAVVALLTLMVGELGFGLASDGITADEPTYIGAGYRHLTASDYRLNPDQPPLAKLLIALPLLGMNLPAPSDHDVADRRWSSDFVGLDSEARPMVARARVPAVLVSLALALLLWHWCRSVDGPRAGLIALVLAAFHPSLLAHGHLATTDLPETLALTLVSWAFWRWCHAPGMGRALAVGLALAAAVTIRLTGWLAAFWLAALLVVDCWRTPRGARGARALEAAKLSAVTAALVVLGIWASYRFHYAPWPHASVARGTAWVARAGHLLPEAYLEGVRFQFAHTKMGHLTYLLGQLSQTGWYYYAVAFLVKNTPGFLLAVLVFGFERARGARRLAWVEGQWLVPALVVFAAASASRIQIGERYILPVYPYLVLLVSGALARRADTRSGRLLLAAVLCLHVLPSVWSIPHGYLAYFNSLAGGPGGGHRVLLDSNLDWGQDLPRLAAWMRRHGVTRVQLAYDGADDPDRYGIAHEDLPGDTPYPQRPPADPFEGTLAVSPNVAHGIVVTRSAEAYSALCSRPPDDRAGVFFIYRIPAHGAR